MEKELSFDDRKRIQLEMLDEIDEFCKMNNIRYSIAFGTLLGAVRHKGFIPWDDDVDIMMPLPDLLLFKKKFKSEKLEYIDIDNDKNYDFPFSRVAHKATYCQQGITYKSYGVCIDLYVLIGLPKEEKTFWEKAQPLFDNRISYIKWRMRLIRRLPISTIPGFTKSVKKDRDFLFSNSCEYSAASKFYVIAAPLDARDTMIYDRDLFSQLVQLPFEDRCYSAIAEWDYFLNLKYGNYMQLPPEDQRHPYHSTHYF